MTKRSVTIATTFALCLALGASALAAPRHVVRARQADARTAMTGLDIEVTKQRTVTTKQGREDLVVLSRTDLMKVAAEFKDGYIHKTELPTGFKVTGWAKIIPTGAYSMTLERGDEIVVVHVSKDGRGTALNIIGLVFNTKQRVPQRAVPAAKPTVNR